MAESKEIIDRLEKELAHYKNLAYKKQDTIDQFTAELINVTKSLCKKKKEYDRLENKVSQIGEEFETKMKLIGHILGHSRDVGCYTLHEDHVNLNLTVAGSFVRQLFEIPYTLQNKIKVEGYGDPRGRDIDIVLFDNKANFSNVIKFYTGLIHILKKYSNEFILFNVVDVTILGSLHRGASITPGLRAMINIPHYKLYFKTSKLGPFEIDMIAWKPEHNDLWNSHDFSVNDISLNSQGFSVSNENTDRGFLHVLEDIRDRRAMTYIDLKKIHDKSIAKGVIDKSIFMQIIFFITERMKICGSGYNICSETQLPIMYIERIKVCSETLCEAPYPILMLKCKHEMTLPSIVQNLYKNSTCTHCESPIRLLFGVTSYKFTKGIHISDSSREFIRMIQKKNRKSHTPETKRVINYMNTFCKFI